MDFAKPRYNAGIDSGDQVLKHYTIVAAATLVSACVYTPTNDINRGLTALKGQDASVAYAALGYPDSQIVVDGDTVSSWGNQQAAMLSTGPATLHCSLKLVIGPDHRVKSYNWNGNFGACRTYADRLNAHPALR